MPDPSRLTPDQGHTVDRETLERYRTALDSGRRHGPWTRATCAAVLRTLDMHADRCEAFDAALNRLNSLYRGEAQPGTAELADKVRRAVMISMSMTEKAPAVWTHDDYDAAHAALNELVKLAFGHVPVEALAASEAELERVQARLDEGVEHALKLHWRVVEAEAAREQAEKERDDASAERDMRERFAGTLKADRDRWENIAAERGTRMDEIQTRAEAAEADRDRLAAAIEQIGDAAGTGATTRYIVSLAREALGLEGFA